MDRMIRRPGSPRTASRGPADRYATDILAPTPAGPRFPEIPGEPDLVVETADGQWCGAIVDWQKVPDPTATGGWAVVLEDRFRRRRVFPLYPGAFLFEGEPVTLVRPRPSAGAATARTAAQPRTASGAAARTVAGARVTASGSLRVEGATARVARGGRIWVEGSQDADLIQAIWQHDLLVDGVVIEEMRGIDHLLEALEVFAPDAGRRVAVIVDHLVPHSKESRIAAAATRAFAPHVLVLGHPYIDVWQAIKPSTLGIPRWPDVPRGEDFKTGTLARLGPGWPSDTGEAFRRMLGRVRRYTDLEPSLVGRVEEAIDFVTAPAG